MIDLTGRVAVVTGAGRGLGRSHALHLAGRGAEVLVNDPGVAIDGAPTDRHPADDVVEEIHAQGGEAAVDRSSVATPEGGRAIIQAALDAFGRVDIVVSNAGILRDNLLTGLDVADVRAVLDVHLLGAINVVRPAWNHMIEQGHGRVVLTTSTSGLFGNIGQTAYAAAKMGILGLTKVWALEGTAHGVTVNAIAPGARTRMADDLPEPIAHMGPELVSPVVVYLASTRCAVTGQCWFVGAGEVRRIFTATGPGRFRDPRRNGPPTPEDIADDLNSIQSTDPMRIPDSMIEDLMATLSLFEDRTGHP